MPAKSKSRRVQKADGEAKPIRSPLTYSQAVTQIGTMGIKRVGPVVREEYLTQLQGARGRAKFHEMYNHDVPRRAINAVKLLMLQATWSAEGAEGPDAEAATEFLESCKDDMDQTWYRYLDDIITGTSVYGASVYQLMLKRRLGPSQTDPTKRSQYDDGLWGWRSFSPRGQETWDGWVWDEETGEAIALIQNDQWDTTGPGRVEIPLNQCLHFIFGGRLGDPNGESLLRSAYAPYYGLKHADTWVGILIERMGGVPVFSTTAESGINIFDDSDADMAALRAYLENAVTAFRIDEQMGVVAPAGIDFDLLAPAVKVEDVLSYIGLCSWRILGSVLAQFLELGQAPKGSYGKSQSDKEFFMMAEEALLGHAIAEVIHRQATEPLFAMNAGSFRRLDKIPRLVPSDLQVPQFDELAEPLKALVDAMELSPDTDLEDHIRTLGKLPPRMEEENEPPPRIPEGRPAAEGEEGEGSRDDAEKGDLHWTHADLQE